MVVAMMGSNDRGEHIPYDKATASKGMLLIRSFKIYKLTRFLELHLLAKAKEMGFYKPDKDRQSAMKTQTYLSEIGLKETSEMSHLTEKSPEKVMESNPKNNNAQVRFGELYRGQGKFHEAEDSFKKAIEIDPKNDEAYVGFGYFYQKRGKLSQAEDSFKKAIEIDPKNDRAWVGLGWLYKGKGQGKFSQAEDAFKKAIEINPQNELAYVELGQLYQVQGEFSKAGDSFKKAIEIDPKNDEAYVGLGFFYNQLGKFTQAEESFKKASGLNPGNDRAFFELGWLYRTQGKFFQAIDFFKKDMEFHPNDGRALSAIASLYEELGKPELAKEYAEKAKLLGSGLNAAVAVNNYRKLKKILDRKGIQLVCVQYPMRNVEMLKRIFGEDEGVIFVDNEQVFKKAVRPSGYKEYFTDMFAGDFGHCTQKGNELLAQNIADVILSEVFNK
jgi:Tfp pilus assembly protein PilF